MDHIATRLVEILYRGYLIWRLHLLRGEPAHATFCISCFVRKENLRTQNLQVGAWFDGSYTDTILSVLRDGIRYSSELCSLVLLEDKQNFEDYLLSVKAWTNIGLLGHPDKSVEVLIKGLMML